MSRDIEEVQRRWQRRYAGRRYVMGVPVEAEPVGSLVDQAVALDIALGRLGHELRVSLLRPIARFLNRLFGADEPEGT